MEVKRHKHRNLSDKYQCNIECIGIFYAGRFMDMDSESV